MYICSPLTAVNPTGKKYQPHEDLKDLRSPFYAMKQFLKGL
jgi:hypothetical protein